MNEYIVYLIIILTTILTYGSFEYLRSKNIINQHLANQIESVLGISKNIIGSLGLKEAVIIISIIDIIQLAISAINNQDDLDKMVDMTTKNIIDMAKEKNIIINQDVEEKIAGIVKACVDAKK